MARAADGKIIPIMVALIAATTTILVGYWQFGRHQSQVKEENVERLFTGRVMDRMNQRRLRAAKVSLEAQGVPLVLYTDSEGIFSFTLPPKIQEVRIVIEASGYEPYDRRVPVSSIYSIEDIQLDQKALPDARHKESLRPQYENPTKRPAEPQYPKASEPSVEILDNSLKTQLEKYLVELDKIERNWKAEHADVVPLAERVSAVLGTRYPESAKKIMTATSLPNSEDVAAVVHTEIQKVLEQINVKLHK